MSTKKSNTIRITAACLAATIASAAHADNQAPTPQRIAAMAQFQAANQQSAFATRNDGSIGRVYGRAFSHGATSQASAQQFLAQNAALWGVALDELQADGPFENGLNTLPIGYLPESDSYKFTGHYYNQTKDGIPVFRAQLMLLVRNENNNPLVLASAQLHDLSSYQPDNQVRRTVANQAVITFSAEQAFKGAIIELTSTERMIYAGVDSAPSATPTLADVSNIKVNGFEEYLIITDAVTGEILYQENMIHTIDITGNASALATEGPGSDNCEAEVLQPLPYLSVGVQGGNSSFTDINGNFTIPNAGAAAVDVDATLTGEWFRVFDFLGSVESVGVNTLPSEAVDLLFNASNSTQNNRAQVNAYIEANRVRDFAVAANPSYPTLMNNEFPITVNRTDGFCPGNAWYSPSEQSINFCLSGGSSPNTAWSSVVHHEYGHHLVSVSPFSGQGQYGEGMGDVMSVIILDDPRLGLGFFGSCSGALRSATAGLQYPCPTDGHACAALISGCVWDTRNAMVASGVSDYTDVLNFLAVNSILLHSGTLITPQVTIDWLTLDDDDSNIGNGTPHYNEIALGFGLHNMDAPALSLIDIAYPAGQPTQVNPNGGTTLEVNFQPLAGAVNPSTPTMMVDSGSGFAAFPMTQISGSLFEATFPASECGSDLAYYITAQTTTGATQTSPVDAPAASFTVATAAVNPTAYYEDDFQTNQGWTVSGNASDGQWIRGVPIGGGDRGDPANDADGSGFCFLTDNVSGNSDVDGGSTILTSPTLSVVGASAISYARWYDNSFGASPAADIFVVEISDDDGASWTNLETVGPTGPEVSGGWITKQLSLVNIAGFTANDTFKIRFIASDLGDGSVVEAGVDTAMLFSYDCDACIADLNGDGVLNFFDISAYLSAFGAGDLVADFNNDGVLNFFDISAFLAEFAAGCP